MFPLDLNVPLGLALHFSCGATKKFDVMRKAEISPGQHSWKEARRRIQQARHRAKKNTNNIDLHEGKLSREKKTCV